MCFKEMPQQGLVRYGRSDFKGVWKEVKPTDFPNYQAGTWGPEAAEVLIAQDGYNWMVPIFLLCQGEVASCGVTIEPQP